VCRDHGWRDGCEAAGVTAMIVGTSDWVGSVFIRKPEIYAAVGLMVRVVGVDRNGIEAVPQGSESRVVRRLRPVASSLAV
jgi:hypothetical protein